MKTPAFLALTALAASALAAACGGNDNPTPPSGSTSTTSGTGSTSTTSGGGSGGGSTSSSTTTSTTGGGAGGGDAGPDCKGTNGCYACAPQTNDELLNACTSAQCSPFDNAARLPLYNGGNLPAIP